MAKKSGSISKAIEETVKKEANVLAQSEMFKEANKAIMDIKFKTEQAANMFYYDYEPKSYHRTGAMRYNVKHFMSWDQTNLEYKVQIYFPKPLPVNKWIGEKSGNGNYAYESSFIGGNHGYGKYNMGTIKPAPFEMIFKYAKDKYNAKMIFE